MIEIRQIRSDEWKLLRQVRLAAVTDSPLAFGESLQESETMPDSLWQERTQLGATGKDGFCVLALDEGAPIGIAIGLVDVESRNQAYLVSMWVSPQHRGANVASLLLQKVITWAESSPSKIMITGVKPGNDRAEAFYKKFDFNTYLEPLPKHPAICGCSRVLYRELTK